MPLLIPEQRTKEWEDAHFKRITASVAAACLGLDPRVGPLRAYNQIMKIKEPKVNKYMEWGTANEEKARKAFEVETGLIVETTGFWVHPECNWLGASPDFLVGEDGGGELKCPQTLPTVIPVPHEVQCRIGMMATGRAWWIYFAWHPNGFFMVRIERDITRELALLVELDRFYQTYIAAEIPPPRMRKKAAKEKMGKGEQLPLSDRELATVLAGLRLLQETPAAEQGMWVEEIATDGGCEKPMTPEEIDDLCERLNCKEIE